MVTRSSLIEVETDSGTIYYFFTGRGARAFIDNLWFEHKRKAWFTGRDRKLLSVLADRHADDETP